MTLFERDGDEDYAALVAENSFVTDVQLEIEKALDAAGLSQGDLARLLGVSEARVSQIMSGNGRNLQARTIARIAHALGLKPTIEFLAEAAAWADSSQPLETDDGPLGERFAQWVKDALNTVDRNPKGALNDNWVPTHPHQAFDDELEAA